MIIKPICLLIASAPFVLVSCSSTSDGNDGIGGAGASSGGTSASGGAGTGAGGASSGGTPAGAGTAAGGAGMGGLAASGSGGLGAGGLGVSGAAGSGGGGGASGSSGGASGAFTLTSPDQMEGAKFGTMFTCAAMNGTFGAGVNPELDWSGVPTSTQSFAITFIDTKIGANMAMGQHWAMWDIPASAQKLPKGTTMLMGDLAGAKQTNKYLAPCPSGNDTYEFTVYALSTATLTVTGAEGTMVANSAGVAKVLAALQAVTPLGTAKLHGTSGPMGQ
jgi:phosphatidylethanolamine-binding protein (PEBP) family uncharacterized protein